MHISICMWVWGGLRYVAGSGGVRWIEWVFWRKGTSDSKSLWVLSISKERSGIQHLWPRGRRTCEKARERTLSHDMTHFALHAYFISLIEMYSHWNQWPCFIFGAITISDKMPHIPGVGWGAIQMCWLKMNNTSKPFFIAMYYPELW